MGMGMGMGRGPGVLVDGVRRRVGLDGGGPVGGSRVGMGSPLLRPPPRLPANTPVLSRR